MTTMASLRRVMDGIAIKYNIKYNSIVYEPIFCGDHPDPEWIDTFKAFGMSEKLLEATWAGDVERVSELIEDAHKSE